jgi:erythronate-4-phosphate dehydrogenase
MAHADIITFHVPLTRDGRFPTFHMADCKFFARLRPGVFLLNAARGAVIDSEALLLAMERDVVRNAVLDVWENEPEVNVDILNRVALGTPHIAGYSLDGKLAGTQQVYHEACHFFEEEPSWEPPALNPPPETNIYLDTRGLRDEEALWSLVRRIYDITQDDRQLRAASQIAPEYRAEKFNALRRDYPVRREFHSVTVSAPNGGDELTGKIAGLGFRGMFPDCEHDRFK